MALRWTVWGVFDSSKYKRLKELTSFPSPLKASNCTAESLKETYNRMLIIKDAIYFLV